MTTRFQVQSNLQDNLGFFANLIFEDNNGDDVTVDGDVGWKALVKLVQVISSQKYA